MIVRHLKLLVSNVLLVRYDQFLRMFVTKSVIFFFSLHFNAVFTWQLSGVTINHFQDNCLSFRQQMKLAKSYWPDHFNDQVSFVHMLLICYHFSFRYQSTSLWSLKTKFFGKFQTILATKGQVIANKWYVNQEDLNIELVKKSNCSCAF